MTTAITFDLLARDAASKAIRHVGDELETLNTRAARFGKQFVASLGLAFGAEKLVEFGRSAVDAFAQAQTAEVQLHAAFERFPKLADTNLAALNRLNEALGKRTGFTKIALEQGEVNLAQFNLTGQQLEKLTPLVVDYAVKTGQTVPEAATLLGRALLGNTRALKSIGIALPPLTAGHGKLAAAQKAVQTTADAQAKAIEKLRIAHAELSAKQSISQADELRYEDTRKAAVEATKKHSDALKALDTAQKTAGASASQFDRIYAKLNQTVGGTASQDTPAKTLREFHKDIEDLEVQVGSDLMPILTKGARFLHSTLIPDLQHTAAWLKRNSDVIVPLAKFVGGLGAAIIITNKATSIWQSSLKAASVWARALGASAATAAPEVATEGTAAAAAATENAALATSARAAATGMEAAGASAAANAGRLTNFIALLARVGPLAVAVAGVEAVKSTIDISQQDGKNVRALTARAEASPLGYSTVLGELSNLQQGTKGIGGPAASLVNAYKQALANADAQRKALAAVAAQHYENTSGDYNRGLPTKGVTASTHPIVKATVKALSGGTSKTPSDLAGLLGSDFGSKVGAATASGIAAGLKSKENTALSAAKSLASKLKTQIASIQSTLNSFSSGIRDTITGNAALTNTGNQTVAGIIHFERHELSIDRAFHTNLAKMRKLGFSAAYISQLAQAGPEQAGNIARQLAGATTSQAKEINALGHSIAVSAQSTADLAAQAYYSRQAKQMAALETQLRAVNKNISTITKDLAQLQRTGHLQTTVR